MEQLKRHLFKSYGGFADKRIKNLSKSDLFSIDGRARSDEDAKGNLFLWFCMMFAKTVSATEVRLILCGNVPTSSKIKKWVKDVGAEEDTQYQHRLELTVTPNNIDSLDELAGLVSSIVAPGAPRYSEPSYKYVCPRVAASLRQFANNLRAIWSSSRKRL